MNREADINRVNRAVEHIKAAVTHLKSIKVANITRKEKEFITISVVDMDYIVERLGKLTSEQPKVEPMPFDCLS